MGGGQPNLSKIYISCNDVEHLPFKNEIFDRIVATCVVAHLKNPELALKEIHRVLSNDGLFSFLIPCEPSILLNTLRHFFMEKKARKLDFRGYKLYISRDHPYHTKGLVERVKFIFFDDEVRFRFVPFLLPIINFNLNIVVHVRKFHNGNLN